MGPIAAPHHAFRGCLDVRLSHQRRVGVCRRPYFGVNVRTRDLDPGAIFVYQPPNSCKGRMIYTFGFWKMPHVIEHKRRREAIPQIFGRGDSIRRALRGSSRGGAVRIPERGAARGCVFPH